MNDFPETPDNYHRTVPLKDLLQPLKNPLKRQWKLAALTILAGWGKFVMPMGVPLITGHLIDDILLQPADANTGMDLLKLGAISVVLLMFLSVATYYRSALAQELASSLQHSLRQRMFYHIQRLSMRFFKSADRDWTKPLPAAGGGGVTGSDYFFHLGAGKYRFCGG